MSEGRMQSYAEAIRDGLTEAAARDPSVLILAEGVDDPSSVFGTLAGIGLRARPDQMIEMPVSENALTGIAIGAALRGKRPVISFHRAEFALLAMEQIVDNAAKTHYVSNGRHRVPLVMRMVVGRGWGQGPAHSQSLESMFAHAPGLKVIMPAYPEDAKGMITAAVEDDNPVICIEHRWCHYVQGYVPAGHYTRALDGPRVIRTGDDLTLVATSYMTLEAVRAADALARMGASATVLDLRVVRPLQLEPILDSVARTGRLLTVDTGPRTLGIGAEIAAATAERAFHLLRTGPRRLGLPDHPTPSSRGLIPGFYPDACAILQCAGEMIGIEPEKLDLAVKDLRAQRGELPIDVPDPFFRGPF